MAWQVYRLMYELQSPVHIGYHKVGNIQRTRYYLPARNMWAACTERLARSGFCCDGVPQAAYQQIGEWVSEHCAFTYFFLVGEDALLLPTYTDAGLCYGQLSESVFERRFVRAHVTTALNPDSTCASEGSLHEVEFLRPHDRNGYRTRLQGWVFLNEHGQKALGGAQWPKWLGDLQVGGERRYGFGRLRLAGKPDAVESLEDYAVTLGGGRPTISVESDKPLWSHTLAWGVKAWGAIEPLVGRQTTESARFGRELTKARICWAPGSVCESAQHFTITANGIWETIKS